MCTGYWIVKGDKTSCGGSVLSGRPEKKIGRNLNPVAVHGSPVSCGKHPGTYSVGGGHRGDIVHGSYAASTLYSRSTCPCNAFFIPSQTFMSHGPYQETQRAAVAATAAPEPVQHAQAAKRTSPPSYMTGEKTDSGFVSDYPALRNTRDFPDENLRGMLAANNQDVMLLTLPEMFEVLSSWGAWKRGWVSVTQSGAGQIVVNYGMNIKDVVTTSMVISQLGSFGIKATPYINENGTELIKLSGYPGIRKILNAPVFSAKNPKIVDVGIGKYGVAKSIVEGARLTFYVAAAFRTVDFILNDETHLSQFIGFLATDFVKIGITSAISWGAVTAITTFTAVVSVPLIAVVAIGLAVAIVLNELDDKFGVTDKVVACIERSQQEFVEKAREMEQGFWDLGAMLADRMLDKGKEVIEHEVRGYIRESLKDIIPRYF